MFISALCRRTCVEGVVMRERRSASCLLKLAAPASYVAGRCGADDKFIICDIDDVIVALFDMARLSATPARLY